LLLLLAFNHGLRVSEVLNLRLADFQDGFLTVQRLKGSMRTVQPVISSENPLLDEKTAVSKVAKLQTVRIFPQTRFGVHKMFQKYCQRAGVPKHLAHVHTLKHSIAMLSIKKAGIENVRQYLGHKSIASTGMYLRVSDEAASKAVQSCMA
jgi:integrase